MDTGQTTREHGARRAAGLRFCKTDKDAKPLITFRGLSAQMRTLVRDNRAAGTDIDGHIARMRALLESGRDLCADGACLDAARHAGQAGADTEPVARFRSLATLMSALVRDGRAGEVDIAAHEALMRA